MYGSGVCGGGVGVGGTGVLRRNGLPSKRVNTENKDVREQVSIRQVVGKKSVGKWLVSRREHSNWRRI